MLACLIYGPDFHYIDHLAPLASLLRIPLVTSEEAIEEIVKKYYPDVNLLYYDYLNIHQKLVKDFTGVIYCFTKSHFQNNFAFAQDTLGKELVTIWCPHGQSDKDNLFSLQEESHLLIYGRKMAQELKRHKIIKPYIQLGDYRYHYFQKHLTFYKDILKKELARLSAKNPTYLYAPTWEDYEDSCSFEEAVSALIEGLPDPINLIIKLHPNMWQKNPWQLERFFFPLEGRENFHLLKDFPLIHPLLDFIDGYIGDMSSIGYDFLRYDKPMVFLKKSPLASCGTFLKKKHYKDIYSHLVSIQPSTLISRRKKRLYDYCYKT